MLRGSQADVNSISSHLPIDPQPASSSEDAKFLVPEGVYERFAAGVGARGAKCGARRIVLAECPRGDPKVVIIASGSEVTLAVDAHEKLIAQGIRSRVVSMPSWEIFERQTQEYRDSVLPPKVTARLAVEQASTFGWERYVANSGRVIGMKTFGASAPLKELQKEFGFEPDRVAEGAAAAANWGANLLISLTFLSLVHALGPSRTFWLYGLLAMGAWLFSYYLVQPGSRRLVRQACCLLSCSFWIQ